MVLLLIVSNREKDMSCGTWEGFKKFLDNKTILESRPCWCRGEGKSKRNPSWRGWRMKCYYSWEYDDIKESIEIHNVSKTWGGVTIR